MTQTDPKTPRADQFQGDHEAFQGASADTMKAMVYTHYGSPDVLQLEEGIWLTLSEARLL